MNVSVYQQPYALKNALEVVGFPLETPALLDIGDLFTDASGTLMFCTSTVNNLGKGSLWSEEDYQQVAPEEVRVFGLPALQPDSRYVLRHALGHINGTVDIMVTPETEVVFIGARAW